MTNLPFKIPEKYNISKNMRSFLKNLCKINFKDRMGKEEFTAINLVEMKENPKMIYFSE